jgi:integral membrane protein
MPNALNSALKFFKITSYVTGTFLMLLVLEMVVRYGFGYDFYAFGPNGIFTIELRSVDGENVAFETGFNVSTAILIVHGWLYVAYLFGDFRLWTLMRWSFLRFLIIASGGIIPMLSFFTERYYTRLAKTRLESETPK